MTKVSIEELPAELAEQIRQLKETIEITDRDRTVARIVPPNDDLEYVHRAPAGRRLGDLPLPRLSFDPGPGLLDMLYEDRQRDRNR